MKRNEIVGRKITRIMRDEIVIERGEPPVPGISDGIFRYFNVFLELDGCDLIEIGEFRSYEPLGIATSEVRIKLTDLILPQGITSCLGESIQDVLVLLSEQIMLRLSSGRYFWVENDLRGTEVVLEEPENVPEPELKDYWVPL